LKTPRGARTLACCIETRLDVRPTPRRVSAQQTESLRHPGVFMTFGGPAGPWELPDGRGSAPLPSRERKRPMESAVPANQDESVVIGKGGEDAVGSTREVTI
jgi:hypothetical protein